MHIIITGACNCFLHQAVIGAKENQTYLECGLGVDFVWALAEIFSFQKTPELLSMVRIPG